MTGNDKPGTGPIRLVGATVCLHYADYLGCVLANRDHFDDWVIVSSADDAETRTLCEVHGLRFLISSHLRPFEVGFNAAFNKAALINEALEDIENRHGRDVWVVIVDADVLLPSYFRRRLEAQPLQIGAIYGLAGRRICASESEFRVLAATEPWYTYLDRQGAIIGYFNLFHLAGSITRYLPSRVDGLNGHDDWRFSSSFPEDDRYALPMPCLHLGHKARNWFGRTTERFSDGSLEAPCAGALQIFDRLTELLPPTAAILQFGFCFGNDTRVFSASAQTLYLVDRWGLFSATTGDPLIDSDRAELRKIFQMQSSALGNLVHLGINAKSAAALLPDSSLDAIFIAGESTYETLSDCLRIWGCKLKPDGILVGAGFGQLKCPDSTAAIALLLGRPRIQCQDGSWATEISSSQIPPSYFLVPGPRKNYDGAGVVVFAEQTDDFDSVISALDQIRNRWTGPCCLLHSAPESIPLRSGCEKLGSEYRAVPKHVSEDFGMEKGGARAFRYLATTAWAPYAQNLFVDVRAADFDPILATAWPDLLADAEVALWSTHGAPSAETSNRHFRTAFAFHRGANFLEACLESVDFSGFPDDSFEVGWQQVCRSMLGDDLTASETRLGAPLPARSCKVVQLGGSPANPSPAVPEIANSILRHFKVTIGIESDTTLVVPVTREDLPAFVSMRQGLDFFPSPPWVLCAIDMAPRELEQSPFAHGCQVVTVDEIPNLADADESIFLATLGSVAPRIKTARWIFVDPAFKPRPGSALFDIPLEGVGIAASNQAFRRVTEQDLEQLRDLDRYAAATIPVKTNLPLPPENHVVPYLRLGFPATCLDRRLAMVAADILRGGQADWSANVGFWWGRLAAHLDLECVVVDLCEHGWTY